MTAESEQLLWRRGSAPSDKDRESGARVPFERFGESASCALRRPERRIHLAKTELVTSKKQKTAKFLLRAVQ